MRTPLVKSITGLLILLITSVPSFAQTNASAASPRTWKVAFIAPLSGPAASYGQSAKNGLMMGLQSIGAKNLQIIEEDDQFQPAKSATIFQKLADIQKIDIALTFGSSPSHAVVPLAEARGIPVLAFATDHKLSVDRPLVARTTYDADKVGAAIAHEAYKLGYKHIGTIFSTNDYSISVTRAFESFLSKSSLRTREEVSPEATEFKSLLSRMKDQNVKELFICALTGQPGLIARQARELNLPFTLFGCNALSVPEELALSRDALRGAWLYGAAISPAFAETAKARFGPSLDFYSAAVYHDLAIRLTEALSKATAKEEIVPLLMQQGARAGALKNSEFKKDSGDQFLDIALEKYIIGTGIY